MASQRGSSAIGIDIATDAIRVAELQRKKSFRVRSMNTYAIGMGALGRDSALNWEALEQTLKTASSEQKLRGKRAHVSIPSALAVIRQLSLPDFSDEELRSVIEFELTNSIHLPFEHVVFDFVRCPPSNDVAPNQTNVILIAADRGFVDQLVQTLRRLGVRTASIDIRPLATYRALKQLQVLPTTFLLVEASVQGTYIHVFHSGLLYLTRQVPVQFAEIALSIEQVAQVQGNIGTRESSELDTAKDAVEFTPGFSPGPERELTDARSTLEFLPIQSYVNRMGAEIDRTVNFFQYTLNQRSAVFEEVIFAGAQPLSEEVKNALSDRVGIPCKGLSFEDLIESSLLATRRGVVRSDNESFNDYTAAIGLALREV